MKFTTDGVERKSYYQMTEGEGFLCLTQMLSYNKTTNIILGQRSGGKSTSASLLLLTDWIKEYEKGNPCTFIYVRVTDKDLAKSKKGYFDQPTEIMQYSGWGQGWYIDCRGEEFYMVQEHTELDKDGKEITVKEEKLCGYCMALNLQGSQKSGKDFSWSKWMLIEEFIPDKKNENVLKKAKFHDMFNLFMSANRMPGNPYKNHYGLRVILLGNNSTYQSDIYKGLGIDKFLRCETHWLRPKDKDWILWQMNMDDTPKLSEAFKEAASFKMAQDDENEMNFAFFNKSEESRNDSLIIKDNTDKTPVFNFIYDGKTFGVWHSSAKDYTYYISKKVCPNTLNIALTLSDHTPTTKYIKGGEPLIYWSRLTDAISDGDVRYASWECKSAIDNFQKWE